MSVDLRGFVYRIEALRRKQQWQFDAAQARLGAAQREVDRLHDCLIRLRQEFDQAALHCAQGTQQPLDPVRLGLGLHFLARLQDSIRESGNTLSQAEGKRDELRKLCALQQQKVDLIEQHRKTSLDAYRDAEQSRERAEADSDWLARDRWKAITNTVLPTMEASP